MLERKTMATFIQSFNKCELQTISGQMLWLEDEVEKVYIMCVSEELKQTGSKKVKIVIYDFIR